MKHQGYRIELDRNPNYPGMHGVYRAIVYDGSPEPLYDTAPGIRRKVIAEAKLFIEMRLARLKDDGHSK